MFLNKVWIENFRGIKHEELKFEPTFNLIIGDNGIGKTSILEAISVGLGGFIAGIEGVKGINFRSDDIRIESRRIGDGSYDISDITPTTVYCNVNCNETIFEWERMKKNRKSSYIKTAPRDIVHYAENMLRDVHSILPIINYQSAGRMWTQKRDKWENPFKGNYSRAIGYMDCLESESNTKMFTNWCKKMEQVSWQEERKIGEYEAVKNAVVIFMNELMDKQTITSIFYEKRSEELMYIDEDKMMPLRLMSSGYRSLVGMVADIAYRMAILNPNLRDNVVVETPGVIMIDELDLHLHPKWQWRIIKALQKTFPKVQFIATTHSPIIIASAENVNIINLYSGNEGNGNMDLLLQYRKSAKGWQIGDVLESYMKTSGRDKDIIAKLTRLEELWDKKLRKNITDREKREIEQLEDYLNANLPEGDSSVEMAQLTPIEDILGGKED